MPNIHGGKDDKILFECECAGNHYVELWYEDFEGKIMWGAGLWLNFLDHGAPLWRVLKNWWNKRDFWFSEVLLSPEDVRDMHIRLGHYLEKYEEYRKKDVEKLIGGKRVDSVVANTEDSKPSNDIAPN